MKSILLAMLVLIFAAGVSGAQETQMPSSSGRGARPVRAIQSPGIGKYSRMLENMTNAAEGMDISAEQKEKIDKVRTEYISSMKKEEVEFKALHSRIMKMVEDPAFDAVEVKKEIEKADAVNRKIADEYIDGLASLRDTLGPEKYTELNKSVNKYRQDLIQMRRRQSYRQTGDRQSGGDLQSPEAESDAADQNSDNADKSTDADSKE